MVVELLNKFCVVFNPTIFWLLIVNVLWSIVEPIVIAVAWPPIFSVVAFVSNNVAIPVCIVLIIPVVTLSDPSISASFFTQRFPFVFVLPKISTLKLPLLRLIVPNDASFCTLSELLIFVLPDTSNIPVIVALFVTLSLPFIVVLPEISTLKLPLLRLIVPNDASLCTLSELFIFVLPDTSNLPVIVASFVTLSLPFIFVLPEISTLKLPLLRLIVPNDASHCTLSELFIFVLPDTSSNPSIWVVNPDLCNNIFLGPFRLVQFEPGRTTSKSFLSLFINKEPASILNPMSLDIFSSK